MSRTQLSLARAFGLEVTPVGLRKLGCNLSGRSVDPAWLDRDTNQALGVRLSPPDRVDERIIPGRRLPQRLSFALTGGGLKTLLRHADRNSTRCSLKAHVPFLTTQMAEFLLSPPEGYLISPEGHTKHIFRKAMRGIVPDLILDRRNKTGFETPERTWLADLRWHLDEPLDRLKDVALVHPSRAREITYASLDGGLPFNCVAWRLISAARWSQVPP